MSGQVYMPGFTVDYHQPNGPTQRLASDSNGHLTGAICPACDQETIYLVVTWRALPVAGSRPKALAQRGVHPVCESIECGRCGNMQGDAQDSR